MSYGDDSINSLTDKINVGVHSFQTSPIGTSRRVTFVVRYDAIRKTSPNFPELIEIDCTYTGCRINTQVHFRYVSYWIKKNKKMLEKSKS